MRRIERRSLSGPSLAKLAEMQAKVRDAPSPRDRARALWKNKHKKSFAEIRSKLVDMAPGRARCMYCEDSLGTDIDHFWPKAEYPLGAFCWQNYLLACSHCNSNEKREQFPRDEAGNPLLVDPTAEDPSEHLLFLPQTGEFRPRGPKGEATTLVFGLNDDTPPRRLPSGRRGALIDLIALLELYDQQIRAEDPSAGDIRRRILQHPFSSVLVWLLSVTKQPGATTVLGPRIVDIVQRHDVASWMDR